MKCYKIFFKRKWQPQQVRKIIKSNNSIRIINKYFYLFFPLKIYCAILTIVFIKNIPHMYKCRLQFMHIACNMSECKKKKISPIQEVNVWTFK